METHCQGKHPQSRKVKGDFLEEKASQLRSEGWSRVGQAGVGLLKAEERVCAKALRSKGMWPVCMGIEGMSAWLKREVS